MCQRSRLARALQHQALLAEVEAIYDSSVVNEQSRLPTSSSPPSPPPPSPLSSARPPPAVTVARLVSRRRTIVTTQAEAANIMLESNPLLDSTEFDPASPTVHCSQIRLQ